jgi:hypothetical protein
MNDPANEVPVPLIEMCLIEMCQGH